MPLGNKKAGFSAQFSALFLILKGITLRKETVPTPKQSLPLQIDVIKLTVEN